MVIKKLPSTGDMPRSTGVPESLIPGGVSDSAGFAWAGRTFDHHDTTFGDDDGRTPHVLSCAVKRLRAVAAEVVGERGALAPAEALSSLAQAHADAVQALSEVRLLIPLLTEAGDTGLTPDGRIVEKSQELSIVTVTAPDGRRVMPAFSSSDTLRAWNSQARPIPVPGPQVALAAAEEHIDLIIVDPGSPQCELGVRRTELEAVTFGWRVVPAWADPDVARAFLTSAETEPAIVELLLVPGDPEARLIACELEVVVHLRPGLGRGTLQSIVERMHSRWEANETIMQRVDSLRVRLVPE